MTKIIDLTNIDTTPAEPKKLKPIKLLACLQGTKNGEQEYYFYSSNYDDTLEYAKTVKKLSNLKTYGFQGELCLLEVDGHIFLAEWNDGVLP